MTISREDALAALNGADGNLDRSIGETMAAKEKLDTVRRYINQKPTPDPPQDDWETVFEFGDGIGNDEYREHLGQREMFRRPDGWYQSRNNTSANRVPSDTGHIFFPINWMAPDSLQREIVSSGKEQWPNSHAQARIGHFRHEALHASYYTRPNLLYKWDATFCFDYPSWPAGDWCLIMQGHSGAYGGAWENPASRQPAIALYIRGGDFDMYVRGSDEDRPTKWTHENKWLNTPVRWNGQPNDISMTFRPTPWSGYFAFFINGKMVTPSVSMPVGMNHSALGRGKPALNLACGFYGTRNNRSVRMTHSKLSYKASDNDD